MSPKRKKAAKPLTASQLDRLGDNLQGSTGNVYTLCVGMFGRNPTDADLVALQHRTGLKRCMECSVWKDTSEYEEGFDFCLECQAIADSDED